MSFSDDQMLEAISKEGVVKESVDQIKVACKLLQDKTGCPDTDIDELLTFLIGRWK
tara:strand:- start:1435 stop:1602 length:168 start_codon:yes stop_codon:yes gene_type:complete